MIGLGSNRLSVCRRGGMSVTQAGKGGMEWLGVRYPLWASPYSAQATAALLAQFPTQWPTIRDYGFAHPEIVGYMNAYAPEDAKIAYSLVEGIGTRWLVGDGSAYINSGTPYAETTVLDLHFIYKGNEVWKTASGNISLKNGRFFPWQNRMADASFDTNSEHVVTVGKDVFIDNGTNVGTRNDFGNSGMNTDLLICRQQNLNACVKITTGGVLVRDYVPFKRNGAMGMIDLLTGTFYGNANSSGSFTESIETPS